MDLLARRLKEGDTMKQTWTTPAGSASRFCTETAEHIKNFSDGYFETADEFNTVANFDGKQYVIHWTL